MPTSTPTSLAANDVRNRNAAARTIELLTEYFAAGDTEGATEEMLAAGHARLENPSDNLGQLAATLGWTRDTYSGRLRRLEGLARRTRNRLARQD